VIGVWGASRVGVHLAPRGDAHDVGDGDPAATFGYLVRELDRRSVAFLCVRESLGERRFGPALRAAFGKLFIANPDLPERLRIGAALAPWNSQTFYSQGPEGYTDYPGAVRGDGGGPDRAGISASDGPSVKKNVAP
jgi:2,4-dienoyl-CoA reductase-like NADH-dependent reductase (Old Yellow Enzyme family)